MMKKNVRNLIRARFIVAAVFVTSICAAVGYAGPRFVGSFTLPYEVSWGKNTLPAGQYRIIVDDLGRSASVQSKDSSVAFFTPLPVRLDSDGGTTGLVLIIRGKERLVRALNLPHEHASLVYQPETRAESEMLAKADRVVTVPLISGGK
jgi:hypothetical protein